MSSQKHKKKFSMTQFACEIKETLIVWNAFEDICFDLKIMCWRIPDEK